MTGQTIDGVPRELRALLERIVAEPRDVDAQVSRQGAVDELRALLDAPAATSDGVNWKAVANEQMGIIQALKAAQPQGEPVAELQVAFFEHGPMATINWFTPSAFEPGATKLYAEQPAPVAAIQFAGFNVVEDPSVPPGQIRMCDCNQGRVPCNGKCKPTS